MDVKVVGWNAWIPQEQLKEIFFIMAMVGKAEDLKIPGNIEGKPYQWGVSLRVDHPLYDEAYGHTDTLEEAKQEAERFIERLDYYGLD